MEDAVDNKITVDKFEIQKKKYIYDEFYLRDSIFQPAQIIGEALTVGLSLNQLKDWYLTLGEVSIEDVRLQLKKFLSNRNYVTGILQ